MNGLRFTVVEEFTRKGSLYHLVRILGRQEDLGQRAHVDSSWRCCMPRSKGLYRQLRQQQAEKRTRRGDC